MRPLAQAESAPALAVSTVTGGFEIRTRCRQCKVELVLRSEDEPGYVARRIASMMVCEACDSEIEAAAERAKADEIRFARLRDSRLPSELHDLSFDEMTVDDGRDAAIKAARAWAAAESPRGLLIHGDVGVGKTRLAATAAWARLGHSPVRFVSVANLIAEMNAAYSDAARREAIKVITGESAIVLDDFDKVNPSEWVRSQLFNVIDRRVGAAAPLLVTTNLTPARISETFGEAIASRLAGYCAPVELKGPDRRLAMDVGFDDDDGR